jgi:Bacterial extracellular solute-binding proteins, family 3/LysM domain
MKTANLFLSGCAALALSGGVAMAQEACGAYVVVAGDNLRYIARSAYGDADLYRVIWEANSDKIGAKADHIEIGMTLTIPCGPGTSATAAPTEEAAVVEVAATVEETTAPASGEPAPRMAVRIVTGNGFPPYVDETLPGGGMFTQLLEMAIFRADPGLPYNMTFINDWQAHIDALLPSLAYDISFPWVRPDCESPSMLTASDISRCENFVFSAPFLEIVDGFFTLRGSPLQASISYDDFVGKRVCRPEGYTTGVLDAVGLTSDRIQLMRENEVTDCFEALIANEVDLVSIDAEVGDTAIAELGIVTKVEQNPHLVTLTSLHAIAHKSNQHAVDMLAELDQGLVEMYESGEWYEIVSTALTAGNKMPE